MVRKQNERTILLQYRIITLSLPTKTLFLILASRPLSTRLGAFSSPETFSHKFFPKFFPIRPRRLFSTFLVRKIMGAKGSCRSLNGGGHPFLYALHISNRLLLSSLFPALIVSNVQTNRAKRGKNEFFFGVLWCFLGIFGDKEGQKPNIFLKVREGERLEIWSLACFHRVHWCRLSRHQDLPNVWRWSSGRVFRPFVLSLALSSVRCL